MHADCAEENLKVQLYFFFSKTAECAEDKLQKCSFMNVIWVISHILKLAKQLIREKWDRHTLYS